MSYARRAIYCLLLGLSAGGIGSRAAIAQTSGAVADHAIDKSNAGAVLAEARTLMQQQNLRAAEALLLDSVKRVTRGRPTIAAELGTLYLQSAEFAKSRDWLQQSWDALRKSPHPSHALSREETDVALALAEACVQLGQRDRAVEILRQGYKRYEVTGISDPPRQILLAARLAALGQKSLGGRHTEPLDRDVDRLLELARRDASLNGTTASDILRPLLAYRRSAGQAAGAIEIGKKLLLNASPTPAVLEVWEQLAEIYRDQGHFDEEIAARMAALGVADAIAAANSTQKSAEPTQQSVVDALYRRANLQLALGEALARGHKPEATRQFAAALANYREALTTAARDPSIGRTALLAGTAASLLQLVEQPTASREQWSEAIAAHEALLNQFQDSLLPGDPRAQRLRVTLGSLYVNRREFDRARQQLGPAVEYWRKHQPVDYSMLVTALNLLGECELELGTGEAALACFREAQQLCEQHLPADPMRYGIRVNLARAETRVGHYRQALRLLNDLAAVNDPTFSSKLRSLTLLNLGLLYKEMLRFDSALQYCQQALELRTDDATFLPAERLQYQLALAGLYLAKRDPDHLEEVVQACEPLCAALPSSDADCLLFQHQKVMVLMLRDEQRSDPALRAKARGAWQELLKRVREKDQPFRARILHYLSKLDYLDWLAAANARDNESTAVDPQQLQQYEAMRSQLAELETQYQASYDEFRKTRTVQRSLPAEQRAAARPRLVELRDRTQALAQRRDQLSERASREFERIEELQQQHAKRDDSQRADFRRQWRQTLGEGQTRAAQAVEILAHHAGYRGLRYAALCNEAQLLQAQSLLAEDGRPLLQSAIERLDEAASIAIRGRLAGVGDDRERAELFGQYQGVFDLLVEYQVLAGRPEAAIVAAEQARGLTLLDQLRSADVVEPDEWRATPEKSRQLVADWQSRAHASGESLVYYHIGRSKSFALLFNGVSGQWAAHRLKKPVTETSPRGDATAADVAMQVDLLREAINTRLVVSEDRRDRLAAASAIVLPSAVQEFLHAEKARGASHVTIVPDGALLQLPLEALVLKRGAASTYLIDSAPPLAYAPSLTVVDLLASQPHHDGTPRLVTVGDPDYQTGRENDGGAAHASSAVAALTPRGAERLTRLPDSGRECAAIRDHFDDRFPGGARILTRAGATELAVRDALKRPATIVHLAVHGLIDDGPSGLFARLALAAPSQPESASNDGYLELLEIYRLKPPSGQLAELAVLSACQTNVSLLTVDNSVRPDPSFSLASAFLAAGARRVVASDWQVADASTSQLVAQFVNSVTDELAAGHAINYAALLQQSREQLRTAKPEWAAPYYWAPFVLVGPAK